MHELIDRAFRGEASPAELARLAAWRASAPACEAEYRATLRLLRSARRLGDSDGRTIPPAAVPLLEMARQRARREAAWSWVKPARRLAPWAVAAGALLALAAVLRHERSPVDALAWGSAVITTGPAELATVTLADGSVVRLGPATELRVLPGEETRDVLLEGRAFFDVAKLAGRPFRVRTRYGEASVLGTRFQVNARDRLELLVVEGRVSLSDGHAAIEVGRGQVSAIVAGRLVPPQSVANADSLTEWVGKFLVFQDTPLTEVAREIERVYGVHVVIADSVMASRTVTATFTNRELDHVTSVVCAVVSAHCAERAGALVIAQ